MTTEIKSGWQKRLNEAKEKNEFLKLHFIYPGSPNLKVKRGRVLEVFDDSFDFEEVFDGETTYSFAFISEILKENEEEWRNKTQRWNK